jgi:nicotinamidase-related amidase
MKIPEKDEFLTKSADALGEMLENIKKAKPLDSKRLENDMTALVIIDMINGFVKEGMLSSPRINEIISNVVKTAEICRERGFKIIAFADCHSEASVEFKSYPVHCVRNTYESELIDELKNIGGIELIKKNSTNGFMEETFLAWFDNNRNISNFIITGDCTDICIMQFSLSLKTYFNKNDKDVNIIIPVDSVETFDLGIHNGDLMNVFSLYILESNGSEIVSEII